MSRPIPVMYYVVSKLLAQQMLGERVSSRKGSVYGVFATLSAAEAFREEKKLTLCSAIVSQ